MEYHQVLVPAISFIVDSNLCKTVS